MRKTFPAVPIVIIAHTRRKDKNAIDLAAMCNFKKFNIKKY